MSDYLWDKTGESDAEVERLEELLGKLRHTPRALELPPDVETEAVRAPRLFRKAWLAIAAALLLAIMAVAFVALRSDKTSGSGQSASQGPQSPARQQSAPQPSRSPQLAASPDLKPAPQPERRDVVVAIQGPVRKQAPRRGSVQAVAVPQERELIPTVVNSPKELESIAVQTLRGGVGAEESPAELAARQQLAKEQLVYALRLTSSKLKEVHQKTQGIVDSKSAFDGRNRIK
jgi:hypothetical protein